MTDRTNDALARLWTSSGNRPGPAELARLRPSLVERLRRDQRRLVFRLGLAGAALAALSVVFVATWFGDAAAADSIGGATALLLLPPWIAFGLFARRELRRHRADVHAGMPVRDALVAAAEATRAALARVRTVGWLHLVSLPLLVLAVRELAAAGKVAPGEMPSLALVLGLLLLATWGGLHLYRSRRLEPRAQRLAGLLADYDESPSGT